MQNFRRQSVRNDRRGTMLPAIAIGLLVAASGIALVLDQLWLSTAQGELQTAANAAALAAAQTLASEELLKYDFNPELWANEVRQIASAVAARNVAVGKPAFVSDERGTDIRLGRPVVDTRTGQTTYVETDYRPTSVIVTAHRDRQSGNPVSLFMPYLTAQPYGDVIASAEASISNHIRAVRPFDHANVPAWPIAILEADGGNEDDWSHAIEAFNGRDNLGWDADRNAVTHEPDGLPEMVLKTGHDELTGNVRIVDLGNGFVDGVLEEQFTNGFSWEQLQKFGSELDFEAGPLSLAATRDFFGAPIEMLSQQIGQSRIVVLYRRGDATATTDFETLAATRLVAVRLLAVEQVGQEVELVVQPTVIATRTAVLGESHETNHPNQYIYRLALTQ